jgi:signal transduction histidine kinase
MALFLVGAICIGVSAAVFYVLWSQQTVSRNLSELQRQVSVVASGVAVSDTLPGSEEDLGGARERLLKVEAGLLDARLAVTDASGTVLFSTAGGSSAASYPIEKLARTGSEFEPRTAVLDYPDVGKVAVTAVPVGFIAPEEPSRYLVGARALRDLRSGNSWVLTSIAIAAVAGLGVAWFLGGWLAGRVTGPLRRLTEGALAVAGGEWGRQVPVEGDDEAARLAGAFNEMSVRVANAYRTQQEFVADVSHELRTPVASIRGFADAITEGVASDEASIKRAAEIIGAEAANLGELTSTLLALADLDAGVVTLEHAPIDVEALAVAVRDRFGASAASGDVGFSVMTEPGTPLGDQARVLQATSALVENALRHAPAGGHVRVRMGMRPGADRWLLTVDDDGPGIPENERERVFGRFTRLDSSRSAEGGGSGLGLAICRRLVELMGGRVWAEGSTDLGGARFCLELPGPDSTETQRGSNRQSTRGGDTPG